MTIGESGGLRCPNQGLLPAGAAKRTELSLLSFAGFSRPAARKTGSLPRSGDFSAFPDIPETCHSHFSAILLEFYDSSDIKNRIVQSWNKNDGECAPL
ncbi:MAG: hypothetical protein RSF90_03055 [Pygmaiobacter sp.]